MIADLIANHPQLGFARTNTTGRRLATLINNNTITHLDPHFPTHHAYNTATTPDIILFNNNTYHNTRTHRGPITTSDHTPIILKISTKPILTPAPPRRKFSQANIKAFQRDLKQAFTSTTPQLRVTPEETDEEIESWYEKTQTAVENHIPLTHHRHTPPSPTKHEL